MGHYLNTVPRSAPVATDDVKSKPLAPSLIVTSPDLTPTPIVVQTPAAATAIQASSAAAQTRKAAEEVVSGAVAASAATADPKRKTTN
jgi:hypothetical protein